MNCNFDVLSIGVDYVQRNDAALNGKGSIYSPYLLDQQRQFLTATKGDIDSFLRVQAINDSILLVKKEFEELAAKYDFISLASGRGEGNYSVYGYIGRKKIKFNYDGSERRTLIPQEMVEQLISAGAISATDFKDSGEKIKLADGTKIFGTSFTLKELKIDDKVFTNVKCKMIETNELMLGFSTFEKDYVDFEIKDGKIWLLKESEE